MNRLKWPQTEIVKQIHVLSWNAQNKIDVVLHGRTPFVCSDSQDPYTMPKKLGKFQVIDSGNSTTTESIVQRVINKRSQFEQRNKIKEEKEVWILNKYSDFGTKNKL